MNAMLKAWSLLRASHTVSEFDIRSEADHGYNAMSVARAVA